MGKNNIHKIQTLQNKEVILPDDIKYRVVVRWKVHETRQGALLPARKTRVDPRDTIWSNIYWDLRSIIDGSILTLHKTKSPPEEKVNVLHHAQSLLPNLSLLMEKRWKYSPGGGELYTLSRSINLGRSKLWKCAWMDVGKRRDAHRRCFLATDRTADRTMKLLWSIPPFDLEWKGMSYFHQTQFIYTMLKHTLRYSIQNLSCSRIFYGGSFFLLHAKQFREGFGINKNSVM